MPFGINVKEVTAQLNTAFDKLYAVLLEIRDELRAQRAAPK